MSDEVNKTEKSSEVKPEVKVYNSKKKIKKDFRNRCSDNVGSYLSFTL